MIATVCQFRTALNRLPYAVCAALGCTPTHAQQSLAGNASPVMSTGTMTAVQGSSEARRFVEAARGALPVGRICILSSEGEIPKRGAAL